MLPDALEARVYGPPNGAAGAVGPVILGVGFLALFVLTLVTQDRIWLPGLLLGTAGVLVAVAEVQPEERTDQVVRLRLAGVAILGLGVLALVIEAVW